MKRGFLLSETKPAGSAAQPASNPSQPSTTLSCIAEVDSWLKANAAAVCSSAEALRIKDVVNVLKVRPSPRKEDVQPFFSLLGRQTKDKAETKATARMHPRTVDEGHGSRG